MMMGLARWLVPGLGSRKPSQLDLPGFSCEIEIGGEPCLHESGWILSLRALGQPDQTKVTSVVAVFQIIYVICYVGYLFLEFLSL